MTKSATPFLFFILSKVFQIVDVLQNHYQFFLAHVIHVVANCLLNVFLHTPSSSGREALDGRSFSSPQIEQLFVIDTLSFILSNKTAVLVPAEFSDPSWVFRFVHTPLNPIRYIGSPPFLNSCTPLSTSRPP